MRGLIFFLVSMLLAAYPVAAEDQSEPLTIEWLGHSSFLLSSASGTKILLDPYTPSAMVDYPTRKVDADVVIMSHLHSDHNNHDMARGKPEVIPGLKNNGDWNIVQKTVSGVKIETVPTFHYSEDSDKGRGKNSVIVMTMDGKRVVHLGDLGHVLTDEQKSRIGKVDILLVPVGGEYTIGPKEAHMVIEQLEPRVIIPMHYKTEKVVLPLAGVDDFLEGKDNVREVNKSFVTIDELPEKQQIVVLEWKK